MQTRSQERKRGQPQKGQGAIEGTGVSLGKAMEEWFAVQMDPCQLGEGWERVKPVGPQEPRRPRRDSLLDWKQWMKTRMTPRCLSWGFLYQGCKQREWGSEWT